MVGANRPSVWQVAQGVAALQELERPYTAFYKALPVISAAGRRLLQQPQPGQQPGPGMPLHLQRSCTTIGQLYGPLWLQVHLTLLGHARYNIGSHVLKSRSYAALTHQGALYGQGSSCSTWLKMAPICCGAACPRLSEVAGAVLGIHNDLTVACVLLQASLR